MEELPIPSTEIEAYARMFDLTDDLQFFFKVVVACDLEYFEQLKLRRKQEAKAKPRPGTGRPPKRHR